MLRLPEPLTWLLKLNEIEENLMLKKVELSYDKKQFSARNYLEFFSIQNL